VEVLEPVGESVGVCVGEGAAVALPDCDVLPEFDGEAPAVNDAVGEDEAVELALSVLLGVASGVEELEPVGDPVGVCVGEGSAETLPDCEALPVALALAPRDSELVGEALTVEDAESVEDGVG
jgi:hypothetical protein